MLPRGTDVKLEQGDQLVAVGSPVGLKGTQTYGRLSAFNCPAPKLAAAYGGKCIQTDAAINKGNSGGPLFLERGKRYVWVGVNTWTRGNSLGFAIALEVLLKAEFDTYNATQRGALEAAHEFKPAYD